MDTKIALNNDEYQKMFAGRTGSDNQESGLSFPYLLILQNDKQFKSFSDKDDMKLSSMGSLFVRSKNGNKSTDLRKTLFGTLISEQKGFEFWYNSKLVAGERGVTVNDDEKKRLINDIPNYDPTNGRPNNIVKLLIKLDTPYKLANDEVNNFVIITIKGTSWGSYLEHFLPARQALVAESEELKGLGIRKAMNTPVIHFHLEITTDLVETAQGENYVFKLIPSLNSLGKVKELFKDWEEAMNYDLITGTVVSAEPKPKVINTNEAEMPVNDLEIDPDSLPF